MAEAARKAKAWMMLLQSAETAGRIFQPEQLPRLRRRGREAEAAFKLSRAT